VAQYGESRCFASEPLSNAVFGRMQGRSYPAGCRVPRASLRHVRLLHYDLDGNTRLGELVCHRDIADDLVAIFRELYRHRYPLQSVRLIDDFDADDERSMRANNTSSFCYRQIKGQTRLSAHAQGKAIDINPLYNPCWRRSRSGKVTVQPSNAMKYCDRTADFPCKIDRNEPGLPALHAAWLQVGWGMADGKRLPAFREVSWWVSLSVHWFVGGGGGAGLLGNLLESCSPTWSCCF
jgi:hypothetical protein